MNGFFFPLALITACVAWTQWLVPRQPRAPWVPLAGGAVWCVAFAIGALALIGDGDTGPRLERVVLAGRAATWIALATLAGTLVVTVWAFVRPVQAPDAR